MYQLISRIFIITICFLFCVHLTGQELIRYTTNQGLPSNYIYDVTQDSNGFMWFATNRGVVKFDGSNFKTFTVKDGLPNNDTWKLEADLQGRVWYFSKSNYQGYIQNDSIFKFMVPDGVVINPSSISKTEGTLWFYDDSRDIHLGVEGDSLKNIGYEDSPELETFFKNNIEGGIKGNHNFFNKLNPILKQRTVIIKNEVFILDTAFNILSRKKYDDFKKVTNTMRNESGSMLNSTYYLTTAEGILFINHKDLTSKYYTNQALFGQAKGSKIYCTALPNEIQATLSNHLFRFNYNFDLIEHISFPESISNHKSYKDEDGNIWLIDLGKGITLQPNTQRQNKYYFLEENIQKIGLIDQSLFVGIIDDGLYEYDVQKEFFEKRMNHNFGKIYQIDYHSETETGYFVTDLSPLEYSNKQFKSMKFKYLGSAKYFVYFNDFIYALTGDNLVIRNLKTGIDSLIKTRVGLILGEVHENTLYVGASDGLHFLEKYDLVKPKIKNELLEMSTLSLLSTEAYLIVGTDGRGIYLLKDDKIIHLKNTEDLSVQRIVRKHNNLWLATQKGVLKVTLDESDLTNSKISDAFYEEDGLIQNNTNDIYLEENILYAACDQGLAKIDLQNPIYQKKPKLYFDIKKDTLQITGGKNNNQGISYSVVDYVSQENYQFEYRLLPNQKEWFRTNTQTVNFSNLPPNLYTLEVKVTDHHGNQSIKKQYLEVIPRWWQTVLAKFGFAVITFILLGGLLKLFQIQIRNKEQKRAQQEKRVAGLELQALRSQMNPHFVNNSLNAILYYIQRSEKKLSEKYLVKFSKLIRLYFENSRKQNITIKEEVGLLNNYLQVEQLRFEDKLQYEIRIDEKIDIEEYFIPSMILQPIVENSVNHGLFHKTDVGTVQINFTYINDRTYKVTIKDDGIGIRKSKEIFDKSSKNYQSRSSAVLKERLTLLKQNKEWDISYKIEDLSPDNRITGTLVTLVFKQPNNYEY